MGKPTCAKCDGIREGIYARWTICESCVDADVKAFVELHPLSASERATLMRILRPHRHTLWPEIFNEDGTRKMHS